MAIPTPKKLKNHHLYQKYQSQLKFVFVGTFNTLLDFLIYGTLANLFHVPQILANIISTSFCTAISFILNYRFVWKSKKSKLETAPGFLAVSLFSAWFIQSLALNGTLAILGVTPLTNLIAKACGSLCGMITNYFGYKLVFTKDLLGKLKAFFKNPHH